MLPDVALAAQSALRALGFRLGSTAGSHWDLTLPNARQAQRTARGDRGRITLSEARKRGDQVGSQRTLLVAPSASPGVIDAAKLGRWDLLLWEGPSAYINGVLYEAIGGGIPIDAPRRRDREGLPAPRTQPAPLPPGLSGSPLPGIGDPAASGTAPTLAHTGGRLPFTRWAVARALLLYGPTAVASLAAMLGVSRQGAGRALAQWGALVSRSSAGEWHAAHSDELLAAWKQAYQGPGGSLTGWRHALPLEGQVRAATLVAQDAGASPLLGVAAASGTGLPATVPVFVRHEVDLSGVGFERVPLEQATLIMRVPKDPTLWATAVPAVVAGTPVASVDELTATSSVNFF